MDRSSELATKVLRKAQRGACPSRFRLAGSFLSLLASEQNSARPRAELRSR